MPFSYSIINIIRFVGKVNQLIAIMRRMDGSDRKIRKTLEDENWFPVESSSSSSSSSVDQSVSL